MKCLLSFVCGLITLTSVCANFTEISSRTLSRSNFNLVVIFHLLMCYLQLYEICDVAPDRVLLHQKWAARTIFPEIASTPFEQTMPEYVNCVWILIQCWPSHRWQPPKHIRIALMMRFLLMGWKSVEQIWNNMVSTNIRHKRIQ